MLISQIVLLLALLTTQAIGEPNCIDPTPDILWSCPGIDYQILNTTTSLSFNPMARFGDAVLYAKMLSYHPYSDWNPPTPAQDLFCAMKYPKCVNGILLPLCASICKSGANYFPNREDLCKYMPVIPDNGNCTKMYSNAPPPTTTAKAPVPTPAQSKRSGSSRPIMSVLCGIPLLLVLV